MHARITLAAIAMAALSVAPALAQDPHAGHTMEPQAAPAGPRNPNLPPAADAAKEQLAKSPRHGEWVDIKMANGPAIKSFVVYPERSTKAPVVIVIHEIFGMADWVRGVADQLAKEGFIAIAPDFLSGKGPNGGGTESLVYFGTSERARRTARVVRSGFILREHQGAGPGSLRGC